MTRIFPVCFPRFRHVHCRPGTDQTSRPAFIVNPPTETSTPDPTIYYTQFGNERAPAYSLRKPDSSQQNAKNRYAVALYDSFNPEVLYAEILLIPEWTQPTLSQDAIRQNGGIPPPPEPILPSEFTIQLYNPDQQILVRQKKSGAFTSTPTWYFDMPQQTFRQPSGSKLDRTQSDPAAATTTPKISLKWKKDSKFSKDLACFLSGKTINPDGTKKKSKEPDITVAIFQRFSELTLYEPNLQRIEIEDWKGFEVVLILGAIAIRDIYFNPIAETFNISGPPKATATASRPAVPVQNLAPPTRMNAVAATKPPTSTPPKNTSKPSRPPPTDPRTQWEIEAEAARLRKQAETEERERQKREAAEQKQIRKMLEIEEKEKRRKQAEVDKETERLKKLYGKETMQAQAQVQFRPPQPPRNSANRYSAPHIPTIPQPPPQPQPNHPYQQPVFHPQAHTYQPYTGGPYIPSPSSSAAPASQNTFFGHNIHVPVPVSGVAANVQQRLKEKKSFWGFGPRERARSGGSGFDGASSTTNADLSVPGMGNRLAKKKSSMF